jgi:hypothetical protein
VYYYVFQTSSLEGHWNQYNLRWGSSPPVDLLKKKKRRCVAPPRPCPAHGSTKTRTGESCFAGLRREVDARSEEEAQAESDPAMPVKPSLVLVDGLLEWMSACTLQSFPVLHQMIHSLILFFLKKEWLPNNLCMFSIGQDEHQMMHPLILFFSSRKNCYLTISVCFPIMQDEA